MNVLCLAARVNGTVRWFNTRKGYGFIAQESGAEEDDVFVHHSAIQMEGFCVLDDGQSVQFEIVQGAKGKEAANVTGPEGAACKLCTYWGKKRIEEEKRKRR